LDRPNRLNLAKGLLLRNDGRLLTRLLADHKLRLYAIAEAETILGQDAYLEFGEIQSLLPLLRQMEPRGDETRLGDALRSVLNGLRGTPPSAVILFSDG